MSVEVLLPVVTEVLGHRPSNLPRSCGGVGLTGRLVCIGQLSVDTVVILDRPLPVGDQACGQYSQAAGGSAAIAAHNAAVLGGNVAFMGFGCDEPEHVAALEDLTKAGVDTTEVGAAAGVRVTILVEPCGERTMISNNALCDWTLLQPGIKTGDVVYFEGWPLFAPEARDSYSDLIKRVSHAGGIVALDVCSASRGGSESHRQLLESLPLDLLFANAAEAAHYRLLSANIDGLLVVHRGAAPTLVVDAGGSAEFEHAVLTPVDTTGAGDTFSAGFLATFAVGGDLAAAVRAGHAAASRVLPIWGALLPKNVCSVIGPATS